MECRVWSVIEDRLIEVRAVPSSTDGAGLIIDGLPGDRVRSAADRVRAALLNSGLLGEVRGVTLRVDPPLGSGATSDLDLALALATVVHVRVLGTGLRWILANGRLGLDGMVHASGLDDRPHLSEIVRNLCRTPVVESERMFEGNGT